MYSGIYITVLCQFLSEAPSLFSTELPIQIVLFPFIWYDFIFVSYFAIFDSLSIADSLYNQ